MVELNSEGVLQCKLILVRNRVVSGMLEKCEAIGHRSCTYRSRAMKAIHQFVLQYANLNTSRCDLQEKQTAKTYWKSVHSIEVTHLDGHVQPMKCT